MLEMCKTKGQDWDALPPWRKNGLVLRKGFELEPRWVLDYDCPIFPEAFHYIDRYVNCEKDELKDEPITPGTAIETQYDREQPRA